MSLMSALVFISFFLLWVYFNFIFQAFFPLNFLFDAKITEKCAVSFVSIWRFSYYLFDIDF